MDSVTYFLLVFDVISDLQILQSDKQFYLDQAKQLKDNFNLKYPDYVYRRRPNNSRKKRRPDSSVMTTDSVSEDLVDDQSPLPEYGEISPVDLHDPQERYGSSGPEIRYPSATPEAYDTSYPPAARASSYQSSNSLPYHPYGGNDRGAPYMSSHEPVSPDTAMGPSTPSTSCGSTSTPYYPSFVPNPQATSYFPSQAGSDGQWHLASRSSREDLGRLPVQSWSQSGQEPSLHHVDDRHRQYQLGQASPTSWVNASPSEPLVSNNSPAHASSYFPTLNSPFYPPQSSSHNLYASGHSPPQMSDNPHPYAGVSHVQGSSATSRQEAAYHGHHYSTMQPGYTPSSGPAMLQYTHSRNTIISTPLSSAQAMPTYPHQQPMNATSPARSATDPSSQQQ